MEDKNFRRRLMMDSGPLPAGLKECEYIYDTIKESYAPTYDHFAIVFQKYTRYIDYEHDNVFIDCGVIDPEGSGRNVTVMAGYTNGINNDRLRLELSNTLYVKFNYNAKFTGCAAVNLPSVQINDNGKTLNYKRITLHLNYKESSFPYVIDKNGNKRYFTNNAVMDNATDFNYFTIGLNDVLFYRLLIKDSNGKSKADLLPCYSTSDGTFGLYDFVNKEYHAQINTGDIVISGKLKSSNSGGGVLPLNQ